MSRHAEASDHTPKHRRARWGVLAAGWAALFVALAIGTERLTAWSAARSNPDDGADIGLDLLLLAGWALAGGLAGAVDGWSTTRTGSLPGNAGLTLRWVVVGLCSGLAAATYRSADDDRLGIMDVLANFALSTIGESVLVAGPAITAAVVTTQLVADARRRQQPDGDRSGTSSSPSTTRAEQ